MLVAFRRAINVFWRRINCRSLSLSSGNPIVAYKIALVESSPSNCAHRELSRSVYWLLIFCRFLIDGMTFCIALRTHRCQCRAVNPMFVNWEIRIQHFKCNCFENNLYRVFYGNLINVSRWMTHFGTLDCLLHWLGLNDKLRMDLFEKISNWISSIPKCLALFFGFPSLRETMMTIRSDGT